MPKSVQPINPTVYLAASLVEDVQMQQWAKRLNAKGYPTICRWTFKEFREFQTKEELARMDLEDLTTADVIMMSLFCPSTSGGRHTELGLAVGLGKRVILVGEREENCFQWLPGVERVDTLESAIESLGREIGS